MYSPSTNPLNNSDICVVCVSKPPQRESLHLLTKNESDSSKYSNRIKQNEIFEVGTCYLVGAAYVYSFGFRFSYSAFIHVSYPVMMSVFFPFVCLHSDAIRLGCFLYNFFRIFSSPFSIRHSSTESLARKVNI